MAVKKRRRGPGHEVNELIKWAESHGCVFEGLGRNGHTRIRTPSGQLVTGSATPSDINGVKAFRRDIEKALGISPSKPNSGKHRKAVRGSGFSMGAALRDQGDARNALARRREAEARRREREAEAEFRRRVEPLMEKVQRFQALVDASRRVLAEKELPAVRYELHAAQRGVYATLTEIERLRRQVRLTT